MGHHFIQALSPIKIRHKFNHAHKGYALPIAMGLGLTTIVIGVITVKVSQNELDVASSRQEQGINLLTAEGHVAKVLADLTEPQNTKLLTLNYDPQGLLGIDHIPNSGDEAGSVIDEWTPYQVVLPCAANLQKMATSDTSQGNTSFTINAYRYNPTTNLGTLLLRGKTAGGMSSLLITVEVGKESSPMTLPGIIAFDSVSLENRRITGKHSNLYFHPNNSGLDGMARKDSAKRQSFLNEISADNGDAVQGNLLACSINPTVAFSIPQNSTNINISNPNGEKTKSKVQIHQRIGGATAEVEEEILETEGESALSSSLENDEGDIHSNSTINFSSSSHPRKPTPTAQTFGSQTGQTTHYKTNEIDLDGSTIEFDTTNGPIHLYISDDIELKDGAKIRNVRSDNTPPQVGDFRIFSSSTTDITLGKNTCIESAFIYAPFMTLNLKGEKGGCPENNALIQGVSWVDKIEAKRKGDAGIHVPQDLSSISDAIEDVNLSHQEKIVGINNWLRINF